MRIYHVIIAVAILAILQVIGAEWLYDKWQWFDIVMHVIGGGVSAIIALAIWDRYVKSITLTTKKPLARWAFLALFVVSFGALVGIAWEGFEFVFSRVTDIPGAWGFAQPGLEDTMADFACDLAGAFAVMIFRRRV